MCVCVLIVGSSIYNTEVLQRERDREREWYDDAHFPFTGLLTGMLEASRPDIARERDGRESGLRGGRSW